MTNLEILKKFFKDEGEDLETFDITESDAVNVFDTDNGEYTVLTDEEAEEQATAYIKESLWAFNAYFIVDYLPDGVGEEVIEALQPQCERANDAIMSMVGDSFEELVEDAIAADGLGHFLNSYDGGCEELDGFVIYRSN